MTASTVDELADQIAQFLDDSGLLYTRSERACFRLLWEAGGTVLVRPTQWENWGPDKTLAVWVTCVVAEGVRLDADLYEYIALVNNRIGFGRYAVRAEGTSSVIASFNLLGDFLNRAELDFAVRMLALEARTHGSEIRERWGGVYG